MNAITPDLDLAATWDTAQAEFSWLDYAALMGVVDKAVVARFWAETGLGALDIAVQNGKWRRMFRGERAIVLPVLGAAGTALGGVGTLVWGRLPT